MPSVLFVCIGNACRSQMAEGWAKHLARKEKRDDIEVFSAGSNPLGYIPEEIKEVMEEEGIDLSTHYSKSIRSLSKKKFDYVISLCGDRCPYVPAEKHIHWDISDPLGDSFQKTRKCRDLIKKKVMELLKQIKS